MKLFVIARSKDDKTFDYVVNHKEILDEQFNGFKEDLVTYVQKNVQFKQSEQIYFDLSNEKNSEKTQKLVGQVFPDKPGPKGRIRISLILVENIGEEEKQNLSQNIISALKELLGDEISENRLLEVEEKVKYSHSSLGLWGKLKKKPIKKNIFLFLVFGVLFLMLFFCLIIN